MKNKKGKKPGARADGGEFANQWTNTHQQNLFLKYYLDPEEEETWGNSYQAAIKAGYSESYSQKIINFAPEWIKAATNIVRLNPEHLKQALASIAGSKMEKASDRIQAIKLLGIDQGMFEQKVRNTNVNIEQALRSLE